MVAEIETLNISIKETIENKQTDSLRIEKKMCMRSGKHWMNI